MDKLDDNIFILDISSILRESQNNFGLSHKKVAEMLDISIANYRVILRKKAVSLGIIKKFNERVDSGLFKKIYAKNGLLFTARTKLVRLPKEIDVDLAYFYGYLQGDGCLTSDKKGLSFFDEYPEQIEWINFLSKNYLELRAKYTINYPKLP